MSLTLKGYHIVLYCFVLHCFVLCFVVHKILFYFILTTFQQPFYSHCFHDNFTWALTHMLCIQHSRLAAFYLEVSSRNPVGKTRVSKKHL